MSGQRRNCYKNSVERLDVLVYVIIATMLVVAGCSRNRQETSSYINLPDKLWAYGDTLAFPIVVPDSVADGNLIVALDHSDSYKYKNLWIEISYIDGAHGYEQRDSLEIFFSDESGAWLGKGIASNYQLETVPVQITLDTRRPITIRHIMRTDTLRDINRVGVFFNTY